MEALKDIEKVGQRLIHAISKWEKETNQMKTEYEQLKERLHKIVNHERFDKTILTDIDEHKEVETNK